MTAAGSCAFSRIRRQRGRVGLAVRATDDLRPPPRRDAQAPRPRYCIAAEVAGRVCGRSEEMTVVEPGMRRMAELHTTRARFVALRMHAFSTGVLPEKCMSRVAKDMTIGLLELAFHAKRVNSKCDFQCWDFRFFSHVPNVIPANDCRGWKVRYQFALNALVSVASFNFGSAHLNHRQLSAGSEGNLGPMDVRAKTDRVEQRATSLFGISACFLMEVIPLVRARFPVWLFR